MLLIKGEFFKTENKYVTIQELRNMVAEEKEKKLLVKMKIVTLI